MADDYHQELLEKVHSLSDLELAALLSLIAREHCLVSTDTNSVDELADELRLIAIKTFGLNPVTVACHAYTTLEDFATALLVPAPISSPQPNNHNSNNNTNSSNKNNPRGLSPFRPRSDPLSQNPSSPSPPPAGSGPYLSPNHHTQHGRSTSVRGSGGSTGPGHLTSPSTAASAPNQPSPPQQLQLANVLLVKNLDRAPRAVQIQALELLRTRRLFTRTSVHIAPKQFLLVAIVGATSGGQARVTPHLNDFFYLAHWHDADEDGFVNLDEEWNMKVPESHGMEGDDQHQDRRNNNNNNDHYDYNDDDDGNGDDSASINSTSTSVIKKGRPGIGRSGSGLSITRSMGRGSPALHTTSGPSTSFHGTTTDDTQQHIQIPPPPPPPLLTDADIARLAQLAQRVRVDVDVTRYQMNIVAFLRLHRAVRPGGGGVSPQATKHFESLARSLAALHGLDYVTPALVGLAAKKVYLHRIEVVMDVAREERSMQWGSELAAVEALLDGVGPEEVIEDVLGAVAVPC